MDREKLAENTHGGNSKKVFGRLFPGDSHANGLLALHRWGPIEPRHYADHAGLRASYVGKTILPGCAKRARPLARQVPLAHPSSPGSPTLLYALARQGYDDLLELAESYWPEVSPEDAIGPFTNPPTTYRWKPTFHHDGITRDVMLAAERDACHLDQAQIVDQVGEFKRWAGKKAPTAIETPLGRRMKSDAANIMRQGGASFADEIEIDLGHETLSSNNPERIFETIEGKIKSYWSVLAEGLVKEKYQVDSPVFRVLFVTTNEARARHIVDLAADCGLMPIDTGKRPIAPNDIFLATTIDQAKAKFFGAHWQKADGSQIALAKRAAP